MPDPQRPYPDGFAWDEAWRQRQRADKLEAALRKVLCVVTCEVAPLMPTAELEAISKELREKLTEE